MQRSNILLNTGIALLVALSFFLLSLYDYLLFHTAVEFSSIVIAIGIFMFTWNARKFMSNGYLLIFGIASLFIGIIDFMHTISYKGMPLFESFTTNLPTQLWVGARLIQAATLLIAPYFLDRKMRAGYIFAAYAVVTFFLFDSIFAGIFPDAYLRGLGLTGFKIAIEYAIIIILAGAAYNLFRYRERFERNVYLLLMTAIIMMVISEFFFTLYNDVYGFFNLGGHIMKTAEFFLIYLAVVHTGLKRPYSWLFRDLSEKHKLKELFVDIMGHDMLNPAGNIRTRAQLALQAEKKKENREHFDFIYEESDKLVKMIQNAKQLARLQEESLEFEEKDIQGLLKSAADALENNVKKKNQKIILPEERHNTAQVNELMYGVFYNLISNASKYSPPGSSIQIGIEKTKNHMTVSVADEGEGVCEDKKQAIFERFSRAGEKKVKGTGLGLAIVKKVVEAHNGKVWVENKKKGSVFKVRFPLKQV